MEVEIDIDDFVGASGGSSGYQYHTSRIGLGTHNALILAINI